MRKNNSDDFDTMEFQAIRPDNPQYQQYFDTSIDIGDLSQFEDPPADPTQYDEPYTTTKMAMRSMMTRSTMTTIMSTPIQILSSASFPTAPSSPSS